MSKEDSSNQQEKRELSFQTLKTVTNIVKRINNDFLVNSFKESGFFESYFTRSQHSSTISLLTSHLPKWGRLFFNCLEKDHENYILYNRLKLLKNCSIDYLILSL